MPQRLISAVLGASQSRQQPDAVDNEPHQRRVGAGESHSQRCFVRGRDLGGGADFE